MVMSRIYAALQGFKRDRSGIAAVEFAFIAPVAMLIALGTTELGRAVVMNRRLHLITAVVSDLVARVNPITDAELTGISTAAQVMWAPYDMTTLTFQVMQLRNPSSTAKNPTPGTIYVDWSKAFFGATVQSKCTAYTAIPSSMIAAGGAMILVNGSYTYKPLFTGALPFATPANWKWTSTSSHSPRNNCTDYNGAGSCLATCES